MEPASDPIVVVGFAARLPQDANTTEGFWSILREARNTSTEVPSERMNMDAFYHQNNERPDTCNVRRANFITGDVGAFDAPFFSITSVEAESMDPQQRVLLETSYHALENAGLPLEQVNESDTGVYIAASNRDYEVMLYRDLEQTPKYMGTGVGTSLLSNRLSWFFDFRGPSISMDTACSGSLTALHVACQALKGGEIDMAIVGGVSLILAPDASMVQLSTLGFLSPDGISYAFDSRANGYAKGEGAGVVVLKRLSKAIENNDTIRAVVRATSINQDGRTPGITQPSKDAQTSNILRAYHDNGLNLDDTGAFEAHGTGTATGDPIEAEAIYSAFGRQLNKSLHIGSLKANIGHLEAAAGVAALIKSILVLEKGILPPNACFEKPNPNIPLEEWGVKKQFLRQSIPFPCNTDALRRISINNFGYGGSNAHAVVDDAVSLQRSTLAALKHCTANHTGQGRLLNGDDEILDSKLPPVLVLSAKDQHSLQEEIRLYEEYLESLDLVNHQSKDDCLRNLVYTLSARRSDFPWKAHCVLESITYPQKDIEHKFSAPLRSSDVPSISLVFTGQGAHWCGMTEGLFEHPTFVNSISLANEALKTAGCPFDLREELLRDQTTSRLDEPVMSQTLCTALQLALVDVLLSWGVRPVAVAGHSSGEIAAAYCAGALSRANAIRIAYFRGRVVQDLHKSGTSRGGMLAVAISEDEIEEYLEEACKSSGGKIEIGCVNSPNNVTVTGDIKGLDVLQSLMEEKGIFARRLNVSIAYHSRHLQAVAEEYRALLTRDIHYADDLNTGIVDLDEKPLMFSSLTGDLADLKALSSPEYWVSNLLSKVQFTQAMQKTILATAKSKQSSGKNIFVEIGPHGALSRSIKDAFATVGASEDVSYLTSLTRVNNPTVSLATLAGTLRCHGVPIDLVKVSSPNRPLDRLMALPDLPKYPFNHTKTYWCESHLSRKQRLRTHARHELLGTREVDFNPLQPRWRNLIRMSEHPWIRDHQLGGSKLYPAAGMLVMALEAARQMEGRDELVRAYQFEDVVFPSALLVPQEGDVIEARVQLEPHGRTASDTAHTFDFVVYGSVHDTWVEACRGMVTVLYDTLAGASQGSTLVARDENTGWEKVDKSQFYANISPMGYTLGPAFQGLSNLMHTGDGRAKSNIVLDDWINRVDDAPTLVSHVIHPVDLDAMLQTTVLAQSHGGLESIPLLVPTAIRSLWISSSLLQRQHGSSVQVHTRRTFTGLGESDFDLASVSPAGEVVMLSQGFRQTYLPDSPHNTTQSDRTAAKKLNYFIEWKADVDLMDVDRLETLCRNAPDCVLPSDAYVDQQELIAQFYLKLALDQISEADVEKMPEHHKKYMQWARHSFSQETLDSLGASNPDNEGLFGSEQQRLDFLERVGETGADSRLTVEVAQKLLSILRSETDALELLFSGTLAADAYASSAFTLPVKRTLPFIDLLAHKNPSLSVLEIGAGTGAVTKHVLEVLTNYTTSPGQEADIPRYAKYTFSDISPAFFEAARQAFQKFSAIQYATLDIERDPATQGFTAHEYDLIVCNLVLHATSDLRRALANVRSLLRPNGKLVLIEPTSFSSLRTPFTFGLLEGWWLSCEPERQWGPCLDIGHWDEFLRETGFSGVDVGIPDHEDARHQYSSIISTAVVEAPAPARSVVDDQPVSVVVADHSQLQRDIATSIVGKVPARVVLQSDLSGSFAQPSHWISLLELEDAYFSNVTDDSWNAFKNLILNAESVLWVTKSPVSDDYDPVGGTTNGVVRALSSEFPDIKFTNLALVLSSPHDMATEIHKVWQRQVLGEMLEPEYSQQDGVLCISRLLADGHLNRKIQDATKGGEAVPAKWSADGRPLDLCMGTSGLLDTFRFKDDDLYYEPLRPGEVEVQVMATGLNFKDTLLASGRIAGQALGFEFSGVVSRTGPEVSFQVGERVCGCTLTGAFKTFARTDSSAVMRIPSTMAFSVAAALPIAYATAYYSLITLANLQEGESVLIHSGAGGVGQAAIQLAQRVNAKVFATVGTDEKRAFLQERYKIPAEHIFSSRSSKFLSELKVLEPAGVDVVLNSLAGDKQAASLKCLAPLGRFIELGKGGMSGGSKRLSLTPFANNISFSSVSLDVVMANSKPLMRRIMDAVSALCQTEDRPISAPYPLHICGVGQIEDAFRYLQDGQHSGKVVVDMKVDDLVPVLPSQRPTYYFRHDATYVIAGGLGGLGRSIIQWMVDRHAKHFLILSRSGPEKNNDALELLNRLSRTGIIIKYIPCDIADPQALQAALATTLPPIRGCINATMVLHDSTLPNMTAHSFQSVLRPKLEGTLNLSHALPHSLDFLLLLSSIASVTGSRGQANYAAANTFQDAFAAHTDRRCVSLNLGAIRSVGYAAEHDLQSTLRQSGFEGVSKAEFFALLSHACDPDTRSVHIVSGLASAETFSPREFQAVYWTGKPMFKTLVQLSNIKSSTHTTQSSQPPHITTFSLMAAASGLQEVEGIVLSALLDRLTRLLAIPAAEIETRRPLQAFAIDSLVSLELRYWISRELKAEVSVLEIMGAGGLEELGGMVARRAKI
ncbi:hypothetical protein PRZ48_000358 [Zasmidium cellare]|uniref:Polyketide synthase n=1 Tax=Zasmidium cellare TaxID=395010 RepID=A0ABR0EY86_ZASCE|nr:hypothetical protein PRZ48_000358 [Zasmidium cellare]